MALENALRELGKEIQKDARFKALQDAAAKMTQTRIFRKR